MKNQKIIQYLLVICLLAFAISCDKEKKEKDVEIGKAKIVLPLEIDCGTTITHTYTQVCDPTEITARKKIEAIFSQHFTCKAACNSSLFSTATQTGTCLFNGPSITYGKEYDITVTLQCVKP